MVDYVFTTEGLAEEAKEQANRLSLPLGDEHNNSFDAFRHAYASARVVQMSWEFVAENRGDAHEQGNWEEANRPSRYKDRYGGQTANLELIKKEITMDMYNNEVGRRYGAENPTATQSELADVVYKKGIIGNDLIQSLGDSRIEQYKEYYLKKVSENKQEESMPVLASNSSVLDIINHAYLAAKSDSPDKAFDQALANIAQTSFAGEVKQEAKELTASHEVAQQALVQQQAEEQALNNPVARGPVMKM